jgi:homogentisate 1,2-dioxygenase
VDVVGWKGDLTVWKINLRNICPLMSPRTHLPPSAHTTLVTEGAVVCSFVPRPLEEDPEAMRVPFFHRNSDFDEFIFYHDGDFFSKDNMRAGMATLHPRGMHHGPHPKALRNQHLKKHTDEYAVMLDAAARLEATPAAAEIEWKEYWKSWSGG